MDYKAVNENIWYVLHTFYGGGPIINRVQKSLYTSEVHTTNSSLKKSPSTQIKSSMISKQLESNPLQPFK